MRVLNIGGLPTSLGEIINFKHHLDLVKDQYDQITIGFCRDLWKSCLYVESADWKQKEALWNKFLSDIGQLFFGMPPYVLEGHSDKFYGCINTLVDNLNIKPQKAEMGHLLCKGKSLDLGEDYIVITTKIREMSRLVFDAIAPQTWEVLQKLSRKYRVIILGERKVEMRKEYDVDHIRRGKPRPFGIYDDIVRNIPKDRILDLTVPALGETVSDLSQIQQDCLIMKEAKFVVNFGVGGNFCLATSVADMSVCYRSDTLSYTDAIFHNREYPNAIVTKDPNRFLQALNSYE